MTNDIMESFSIFRIAFSALISSFYFLQQRCHSDQEMPEFFSFNLCLFLNKIASWPVFSWTELSVTVSLDTWLKNVTVVKMQKLHFLMLEIRWFFMQWLSFS